jgi:hypothetical protein
MGRIEARRILSLSKSDLAERHETMKSHILPPYRIITAALVVFFAQSLWLATGTTAIQAAEPPEVGQSRAQEKWILRTDDTELVLGVSADQKLCIYQFSGPGGWNWTNVPSVVPLLDRVDVAGAPITPAWTYREATVDEKDGVALTVVFTCANPALELRSVWQTYEGPGPVHLSMFIVNKSDQAVTIYEQESLDVRVSGPGENTSVRYINDDGVMPDQVGVYRDLLTEGYRKELRFSEDQDYIPLAVIDAGGAHGVYFGWEWSIGRMAISTDKAPGGARVMLDVNWWDGDTNRRVHPPIGSPTRWPKGILPFTSSVPYRLVPPIGFPTRPAEETAAQNGATRKNWRSNGPWKPT